MRSILRSSPRVRGHLAILLVAVAYVVLGKLGLLLATAHPVASPIWPATGLALCVLLLGGSSLWPGIFLGAFVVNATSLASMIPALTIAAGNTLEALAASFLIRRFTRRAQRFVDPQELFTFAAATALATSLGATVGTTSLVAFDQAAWDSYGMIWLTWWLGDLSGALIVTPLLMLLSTSTGTDWTSEAWIERLFAAWLLLISAGVVYGGTVSVSRNNYPVQILVMPPLIWSAVRFHQRDTAIAVAILSAVAIYGTARGYGPFASAPRVESMLLLQSFLIVCALTVLSLGAAVAQQRASRAALAESERNVRRLLREAEQRERDLREKQQQLVQSAKLASIGELATGIAHEVNNPLNNISLYIGNALDYLNEGRPARTVVEQLRAALQQVQRAATIINHLRTFGRAATAESQPLSANELVRSALQLIQEPLRLENVEVVLDLCPQNPVIVGNRIQLEQVLLNLFTNAKDAVQETPNKTIRIATGRNGHSARIVVEDSGPGVPPHLLPRIFDPFFTTKPVGRGTGLGLSIVYSIVREHRGSIAVENRPDGGARFAIELPTHRDAAPSST
ncbi:MASE1 domain-containing protein [Candidatus Nitrospira bockiana]